MSKIMKLLSIAKSCSLKDKKKKKKKKKEEEGKESEGNWMRRSINKIKEQYLELTNTLLAFSICISWFSRETKLTGCVYTYREIYFKHLVNMIRKTGKSKICRRGQQARDPGKSRRCNASLNVVCSKIPSCRGLSFVLIKPSTDWMGPTQGGGNLLYAISTNLNVSLIWKKTPSQNIQENA